MSAEQIIELLQLQPHPEGGFYKETYRGADTITIDTRQRSTGTAIYYMLKDEDKSHFHKVASDELWFFHQGEPIDIYVIEDDGQLTIHSLGNDLLNGQVPQVLVTAGKWFAAKIKSGTGFSLASCTVSPGFDFADFILATKAELLEHYPQHRSVIEEMTMK